MRFHGDIEVNINQYSDAGPHERYQHRNNMWYVGVAGSGSQFLNAETGEFSSEDEDGTWFPSEKAAKDAVLRWRKHFEEIGLADCRKQRIPLF